VSSVAETNAGFHLLTPLADVASDKTGRLKHAGGKAHAMARLIREGFFVPSAWVLDGRVFSRALAATLPRDHDLGTLIKLAGSRAGAERAARVRERLLEAPLPESLVREVTDLWRQRGSGMPWGLAVRSSATCEDTEDTSLAGVARTVLGVRGPDAILAAIREVWASAVMPRTLAYLAHAGLRDMAMAVVLQEMVCAESAGVMFTAPPAGLEGPSWRADERLIHATLGLASPVVDGATAVDSVRFARHGGAVVAEVIVPKPKALVVGDAGLEEVSVPEPRASRPALSSTEIAELSRVADALDGWHASGLDVEFAIDRRAADGPPRVWILQARPLIGRGYPEGGDASTVWSRANVGEALPGAATPLTWSVARGFSDRGFREAFAALGCKVERGETLVSNVHGRFYLNLTAFMRVAAQVPGLTPRRILGVSGGASEAVIAALEAQVATVHKRGFVLRLPLTVPRLVALQARLEAEVERYEAAAGLSLRKMRELDLGLLPDDSLATSLRDARALLDRTGSLMLRAASASLASHVLLSAALARLPGQRRSANAHGERAGERGAEQLALTLTGGADAVDSAAPGIALLRVAEVARHDTAARERLERSEIRRIEDFPEGATKRAFEAFLNQHGDRAIREAELATPRWREDPASAIAMLTSALRLPSADPDRALARARSAADRELASLEARSSAVELLVVRALIARAQRFARLRERMRTWVTRVLGLLRMLAIDIDRRMRRIDPTLPHNAVFFCTDEELTAALASGRAELGTVVRLRLSEYQRDASRPDPPPTFIGRPPPVVLPPLAGTTLVGLSACAGVAEGRARVLLPGDLSLDTLEPGEVLVSRTTDIGLTPLFLVAAAVVTELGGPLSHAAVVAREYGVPTVVNVPGATSAIRTGDRVRVDGDRGVVECLARSEEVR
jgi:pyruvate,water dikinase